MKLGAFITITDPFRRGDPFIECHQMAQDIFDTVTVVDGRDMSATYILKDES